MDCYELTIITIKDLIGKADGIDGYTLMKYLSGKFESIESQLFSVDAEQVIIHAPEQYGTPSLTRPPGTIVYPQRRPVKPAVFESEQNSIAHDLAPSSS